MHIDEHLYHNYFHDRYQSSYRKAHSTETVFLKVHSDIADAFDEGYMTALIMFGLYAAVDIIDHPIILIDLEFYLGTKERFFITW